MAILTDLASGQLHHLGSRCVLGRSSSCRIRLPDRQISGEHAVLAWHGPKGWQVQDLGSRNGTWANGQQVQPGGWVAVPEGAAVSLAGDCNRLELTDGSPPQLCAVDDAGEMLSGRDGLLVLARGNQSTLVFENSRHRWILERNGSRTVVTDGNRVLVGDRAFRLVLPTVELTTVDLDAETPALTSCGLRFAVSRHEEQVDAFLVDTHGRERSLAPRAHTYMLLTLARARLRDRAAGADPSEEGWVHKEDLQRLLRRSRTSVNVAMFRAREQLARAGVRGAGEIIEWRVTSREVRIGVTDLSVG